MENFKVVITNIFEWLKDVIIIKLNIPTISEIETIKIFIAGGIITAIIGLLALGQYLKNRIHK